VARNDGQNLTYRIVQALGVAIVSGTYTAKNPFPIEADLCKQYGASRSVLREAVKMLTAKGLLSARPRQGTWVQPEESWNLLDPDVLHWLLERKPSYALLREFAQVRLAVEPKAAALAATIATSDAKAAIRTALEQMAQADRDEDDPLPSDIAFHLAILRASGNRFYSQLSGVTESALRISIRMQNRYKGVRRASVPDHRKICDAIMAGDAERAEAATRALVQEALDLINKADTDGSSDTRQKVRSIRS
jgi:DNA-binding FadR family transcriptional regulator